MMSKEAIYVISTLPDSKINKFKLVKHTGAQKKLLSKYSTYYMDPIIFYYKSVDNSQKIENIIKRQLKNYGLKHKDGTYTEWVSLDLETIIDTINIGFFHYGN